MWYTLEVIEINFNIPHSASIIELQCCYNATTDRIQTNESSDVSDKKFIIQYREPGKVNESSSF